MKSYIYIFSIFISFFSFSQNEYKDLESLDLNKKNRYIVTSQSLKVRIRKNDNYYNIKASTPFYKLKKGDVVRVHSAKKGVFGGVESTWYEVSYDDPKTGMVVYPPNRKKWHPRTVWGIVDGRYLKELSKKFFIINKDYTSLNIIGRKTVMLMKGDTIIAEDLPYRNNVRVSLVKGNEQFWFYDKRAGGGSRRGGFLDNSLFSKLTNQDSLDSNDYVVSDYISEEEYGSILFDLINKVLFLFLIIGVFILLFLTRNKPKYLFIKNQFKINKRCFNIDIIKGEVVDVNRYQRTNYSSTPGRAYKSGNTINFTTPTINLHTSNHSEIWIRDRNGKEHLVTRNYDINSARIGSMLTWIKLQNNFTLGLLYHNLRKFNYTESDDLKEVIDNAVPLKLNFSTFGIIIGLFGLGLYSIINFIFFQYFKIKDLFGYTDRKVNFFSFDLKISYIQFFCFTIILLVIYYAILSMKRKVAIKKLSKKLENDLYNLCNTLT